MLFRSPGVLLQVPADLADARGPGLTGVPVTNAVAAALRTRLIDPRLAAAAAVAAFTGIGVRAAAKRDVPAPPAHHRDLLMVSMGRHRCPAFYTIPAPARPLLDAAIAFTRLARRNPRDIFGEIDQVEVDRAASDAGIILPAYAHPAHQPPWHTRCIAWILGTPLHGILATARSAPDPDALEQDVLQRVAHMLHLPPATPIADTTAAAALHDGLSALMTHYYMSPPTRDRPHRLAQMATHFDFLLHRAGHTAHCPLYGCWLESTHRSGSAPHTMTEPAPEYADELTPSPAYAAILLAQAHAEAGRSLPKIGAHQGSVLSASLQPDLTFALGLPKPVDAPHGRPVDAVNHRGDERPGCPRGPHQVPESMELA